MTMACPLGDRWMGASIYPIHFFIVVAFYLGVLVLAVLYVAECMLDRHNNLSV